jgi:hypothetical protein
MGLFPVREKMGIIISHAILKVGINQRLLRAISSSISLKVSTGLKNGRGETPRILSSVGTVIPHDNADGLAQDHDVHP